ncbi:MAG: VWA domain-containing protein [Acidobacteriota bacterium]
MSRAESAFPTRIAAGLLLLGTVGVLAQSSPPSDDVVSQEIEVHLAEIEVMVTDRQGDSVTGLERQDFEVLQDGEPVELTHFRAIAGGLPVASADALGLDSGAQAASLEADRLNLVVYIDRSYLELGDLSGVREALKSFLRESLRPGDRTMLVSAADALELTQSFTSVPELVVTKLESIRERPGGGRFAKEYQSILVDMRRTKSEGIDLDARDPRLLADAYFSQVQAFAAEVEGEIERSTAHLQQLIRSIAGLEGRRAVLYVGGRVPAAYSRNLFEVWDETFGRNSNLSIPNQPSAVVGGIDSTDTADQLAQDSLTFNSLAAASAGADVDSARLVEDVARIASAHEVVFHTLDASSLRGSASTFSAPGDAALASRGGTGSRPGPALLPGSLADNLSSLRALATGTGGRSHAGHRDFSSVLARIGEDLETFYSLGFTPLATRKNKDNAKIEVRLRGERRRGRDKLTVRHRSHLRVKDRDTLAAERTVSALLLEEMENPLRVELAPGEATPAGKDGLRVPVVVTLPLARLALVADGRVHTGRLSIFAASGGLDRVGSVVKAVVPVRIPNQDLLTSLGRRVSYQLELTLPPGQSRIAVTVRDDFRPESSTAMTSLLTGGGSAGALPNPVSGSR